MKKAILPDWFEEVKSTPANTESMKYTKKAGYGAHKYTAINAQYQILEATKVFGLYGYKWGVKNLDYKFVNDRSGQPIFLTLQATFFYTVDDVLVEFPIATDGQVYQKEGAKVVDDLHKKLLTDVTTKALSKIGFNSDIFLGMYDQPDYVSASDSKTVVKSKAKHATISLWRKGIEKAKFPEDVQYLRDEMDKYIMPEQVKKELTKLCDDKENILQSQG